MSLSRRGQSILVLSTSSGRKYRSLSFKIALGLETNLVEEQTLISYFDTKGRTGDQIKSGWIMIIRPVPVVLEHVVL